MKISKENIGLLETHGEKDGENKDTLEFTEKTAKTRLNVKLTIPQNMVQHAKETIYQEQFVG